MSIGFIGYFYEYWAQSSGLRTQRIRVGFWSQKCFSFEIAICFTPHYGTLLTNILILSEHLFCANYISYLTKIQSYSLIFKKAHRSFTSDAPPICQPFRVNPCKIQCKSVFSVSYLNISFSSSESIRTLLPAFTLPASISSDSLSSTIF